MKRQSHIHLPWLLIFVVLFVTVPPLMAAGPFAATSYAGYRELINQYDNRGNIIQLWRKGLEHTSGTTYLHHDIDELHYDDIVQPP